MLHLENLIYQVLFITFIYYMNKLYKQKLYIVYCYKKVKNTKY